MLCARILKLSLLRVQHNNYYNIVVSCILYRHKDYHLYANNMRVAITHITNTSEPAIGLVWVKGGGGYSQTMSWKQLHSCFLDDGWRATSLSP